MREYRFLAFLLVPMTWLHALELYGTFIDVPPELLPLHDVFRFDDELQQEQGTPIQSTATSCGGFPLIHFIHMVSMKRALPSWAAL